MKNFPQDYATTQGNLGFAYRKLSEIKNKEANLNKAIGLFNEALKVYDKDVYPDKYKTAKSLVEIIRKELCKE